MNKKKFSGKLHELLIGKRSLKERLLTALFPSLSLSFILFFFGPLDLSYIARDEVDYTVPEILPSCLKLWAITFAALFLISWIAGGKLHVWLVSLYAGLTAAFYIQGNFLNIDLGTLNGETIQWQKYGDNALAGLAVFIGIIMIPFLIRFFSRKLWQFWVIFVSVLLLIMQTVPLGIILGKTFRTPQTGDAHYIMAKDKEFVLGKENIVVFLLDYTSPRKMTNMLRLFPDTLEPFHDFTEFDNYNTEFVGTFPASTSLLTHEPYDAGLSKQEWFYKAWHSDDALSFYSQMQEKGWNVRLFNNVNYVCGDLANEYGLFSTVEKIEGPQQFRISRPVFRKLIKLSFYRYFPLIMKAPFWLYTEELNAMKEVPESEQEWNRIKSVFKYMDQRLTVGNEEKVYVSYHWAGAHEPFYIDEVGKPINNTTGLNDMEIQLAGHFHVISEYIQQMKDYHIYDSSTIIITTDHGDFGYPHSIYYVKPAGQRQDRMDVSHAPVTQSDFMATLAVYAGLEDGQFGRSFYDVPEDEDRERCSHVDGHDYCYHGDGQTLYRMVLDGEYIGGSGNHETE